MFLIACLVSLDCDFEYLVYYVAIYLFIFGYTTYKYTYIFITTNILTL